MAERNYIVIRREDPIIPTTEALRRSGPLAGTASAQPQNMEIIETQLTKAERDDLRRDPRTTAMAESMPMKLIKPKQVSAITETTSMTETWGLRAVGASGSPFAGQGITVAVLDTGIEPSHPAFQGVELVQKNFTSEGADDIDGHGTHCAGTIFGKDVNGLRIGVARNIQRALIGKVLGQDGGDTATIAKAIQWAVNEGAHVVSMSLSIDFPGYVNTRVNDYNLPIEPATSKALEQYRANVNLFSELAEFVVARGSFAQGSVLIGASGNESNRPTYEIGVGPPAAGTGIIAVGALKESGTSFEVAEFSNTQVNISGPGVDVISAYLGGGLGYMSGTSMAAPHVTGVTALWAEKLLSTTGRVHGPTLMSQLVASGTLANLIDDSEAEDVGTGMVQAPQA